MVDQYIQEVASNLGNLPFVYYGSYQIDVHDINFFILYYDESIPRFKMSFYDTLNLLKDKAFPMDDTKIKLFLNPRSTQLKEILLQFKITNFSNTDGKYTMEGILDVNLLHVIQYKSYPSMSSLDALKQVSKEAGLGFNTNIDSTDDVMTWINPGDVVLDFMDDVISSSYKGDTTFIASYVDYYYNFNVVDLAKELERNIDNDLGISDRSLSDVVKTLDKEVLTNLIITNDESMRETNMFFEKHRIVNNSTEVSLNSGYNNTVNYYDTSNKNFLIFNMSSITSKGDKTIILKGSPQDSEFFKLNTKVYDLGKIDTDNMHKNYAYAQIQNEKNIFDLEKVQLEVNMRTPNYGIYKYQKIKVFISNQTNTPSANLKNERLSGDWLVIDIKYMLSDNKFVQILRLIKRELELSDIELANEPPIVNTPEPPEQPSENVVNNEINANPDVPVAATQSVPTPISSTPANYTFSILFSGTAFVGNIINNGNNIGKIEFPSDFTYTTDNSVKLINKDAVLYKLSMDGKNKGFTLNDMSYPSQPDLVLPTAPIPPKYTFNVVIDGSSMIGNIYNNGTFIGKEEYYLTFTAIVDNVNYRGTDAVTAQLKSTGKRSGFYYNGTSYPPQPDLL